jgi:hypothetical protein
MPSRLVVGVAIGVDSLTATWYARGGTMEWSASLARDGHSPPPAEALRAAFADLRLRLPAVARTALAIAILPPLARVRRIELPCMSDDDRRLAVSRVAERYFIGLGELVVCAVERLKREGAVVPFLAAAVSCSFISDLEQIAGECGWLIDRIVPAHAAWVAAGATQWRELRRGDGRLAIPGARETTVLMIRGGGLCIARRVRRGAALLSVEADAKRSLILGDGNRSAALIAADAARITRSLELTPDATRKARRNALVRVTRWLLCVAAACFVAACGVYRWGLSHHLAAIAVQRNALRPRVNAAVAARDTLDRLLRSIDAMQSREHAAPRWSSAVARIALALPGDASLIALRADGDSISLDGQAGDAASVFAALRSAPGLAGVRSTAPIRQELTIGQSSIERWTIALRVAENVAARGDK